MRTERNEQKPNKKKSRRALKVLLVLILILAAAIAGTVYYTYRSTMDSLAVNFTKEHPAVEAGGSYASMDYVADSVGEVTVDNEFLEADTIGDKALVYTVTQPLFGGLLNPSKEFTLSYSVVDTIAPLILWNGSGTVLARGSDFDINNVLAYGDNIDPKPSLDVSGEVDMSTSGSYPLHARVTDASGNSAECDLTIYVSDSLPSYTDNAPRTKFSDFVSANKGDGRSFGIDVSTWQGDIDFKAVKAAGCDFVIMRIGYSVDGVVETDGKFDQNYKRARDAGLKVGIYLFSYDNTEDKARASADWIIEKLGGDSLDLPVVFDWEDFGHFQAYEMSFTGLNKLYDAFADQLSRSGYDCMLYGSKNYLEKIWTGTDERPVWLAHYTDKTDYKGPYVIWQASCTGRIDGIAGDVDMDIMYQE